MSNIGKKVEVSRVPSPISPRPSKEILKKSKFFQNKNKNPIGKSNNKNRQSYVQALFPNIKEILKIKESFPNISLKKIEEIHKTINIPSKPKSRIKITTKRPSRWQIIVYIKNNNISKFISLLEDHIANIHKALKISNQKSWLTLCTLIIEVLSLLQTRWLHNLILTLLKTTSRTLMLLN